MLISWLTKPIRRSLRALGDGRIVATQDLDEVVGRMIRSLEETPLEGRRRGFLATFVGTGPFQRAFDGKHDLDTLLDEATLVIASIASVSPALGLLAAAHFASGVTLRVTAEGLLPGARVGDGLVTSLVFDADPVIPRFSAKPGGEPIAIRGHRLTFPTIRTAESMVVIAALGDDRSVVGLKPLADDSLLDVRRSAFDLEGLGLETGGIVLHGALLEPSAYAVVEATVDAVEERARAVRDLMLLAVHRGVAGRALAELHAAKDAPSAPLSRDGATTAAGELVWLIDALDADVAKVRRHLLAPTAGVAAAMALREGAARAREVVDRTRRILGPRALEGGHVLTRIAREADGLGIYEQERSALVSQLGALSLGNATA